MGPSANGDGAARITYGQPRFAFRVGDLTLTETRHRAGTRLRPHEHELANLYLPLAGRFRETIERRTCDGAPGTVLIKPDGARHSNEYESEDVVGIVIEVPRAAQERLELGPLFHDRRRLVDDACARIATALASAFRCRGPARGPLVEGLVHELFGALRRRPHGSSRRPAWLDAVRDLVTWEPRDGSLEHVAAAVGRNPSHVAREFRRYFGTTVGDYARRRRVEEASTRLRDAEPSIAEIALRAGFCDQAHFTHAFRQVFRTTPAEYRRSLAGQPDASEIQDG